MNNYTQRATNVFKHWHKHQIDPRNGDRSGLVPLDSKMEQDFWDFVALRMSVFNTKETGAEFPWTSDVIMSKHKFCNVYRELDKTSIDLHEMVQPVLNDFKLTLLNFAYMRWVGLSDTVKYIGLIDFSEERLNEAWQDILEIKKVKYTSAYNPAMSGILNAGCKTREEFTFSFLPKKIPAIADKLAKLNEASLEKACTDLGSLFGFNARFMAMEIFMDMAYQFPDIIDENKPVFIGRGAVPSVKAIGNGHKPEDVLYTLYKTQPIESIDPFKVNDKPVFISIANLENNCCEFRKYQNLKNGTGLTGKRPAARKYKA